MVFQDQELLRHLFKDEMDFFLHQVIAPPLEYLMDELHPYKNISKHFYCMLIDVTVFHLANTQFVNEDIFFPSRSFIPNSFFKQKIVLKTL